MTETRIGPKWQTKPLNEVAEIERQAVAPGQIASGTQYVGLEHITSAGGFVGVKEVSNGELASTKFRFGKQHILYGKLRPYLSKIARPAFAGICSTDILPILPGKDIDRGFLFHYLRQPHMVELAARRSIGANLPRLSPKQLALFEIPVPPLAEQKRIATILDKADAIRRKRREAQAEVSSVIDSRFLEVFGDPLGNPRRWAAGTFDDHLTLIQYGPRFYNEAYSADGIRIVRITDLDFQGRLDYSSMPLMSVDQSDKARFCLRPGDLLLARSGATVGKTALIDDEAPECIAGAYFIRLRFSDVIRPLYAQMVLRSKPVQKIIAERSRQSAQQNFNGLGMTRHECEHAFGSLGGSAKIGMHATPAGRIPHGKSGKGRFRAFGIGPTVTWVSRYKANGVVKQFDIKSHRSFLKQFEIGDEKEISGAGTGVEVTIEDIGTNYPSLLDASKAAEELSKRLALYLRKYPGIAITYEGLKVDPSDLESNCQTYDVRLEDKDGAEVPGELTVIEWKSQTERALYLCDDGGFALEECPPGIQARGFHFTAYLKSQLIPELVEEGAFAFEDMHPVVNSILDKAKQVLRDHFRGREASRAGDLIKQWQEEQIYPYQAISQDPLTQATREVFDVCAVKVHEYLPSFEKSDTKSKLLTFRLIKEALESNPASLQTILRQVLGLPQEQQDDLARILGRTHLAAIINAAKTVVDRLDFIGSLDDLLFGEFKKTLLERKQLHRILAEELWIFGEQYTLGVDDQSLANVLKKHVHILGRQDLAPEETEDVKDIEGKQRIIDLMLHRQIPQLQPDNFEHLVIELKRPDCKLGQEELGQIEKYAFSVADDERFDKSNTKWTFLLIGNDLAPFAERKCRVQGKEFGHIHASDDGSVNIFVKRWSTIIAEANWRYKFFRDRLELEVTSADGLRYLRERHRDRLPVNSPKDTEK